MSVTLGRPGLGRGTVYPIGSLCVASERMPAKGHRPGSPHVPGALTDDLPAWLPLRGMKPSGVCALVLAALGPQCRVPVSVASRSGVRGWLSSGCHSALRVCGSLPGTRLGTATAPTPSQLAPAGLSPSRGSPEYRPASPSFFSRALPPGRGLWVRATFPGAATPWPCTRGPSLFPKPPPEQALALMVGNGGTFHQFVFGGVEFCMLRCL